MSSIESSGSSMREMGAFNDKAYAYKEKDVTTVFLPAYLVVLFKQFGNFDFEHGSVDVNLTLILHVLVEDLSKEQRDAVRALKMRINEDETIALDKDTCEVKEVKEGNKVKYLVFTRRAKLTILFCPTLDNFPFDVQNLNIKFELTSKTVYLDSDVANPHLPHHNHPQEQEDIPTGTPLTAGMLVQAFSKALRDVMEDTKPLKQPDNMHIFRFNCHLHEDKTKQVIFKLKPQPKTVSASLEHGEKMPLLAKFKPTKTFKEDEVDNIPDLNIYYTGVSRVGVRESKFDRASKTDKFVYYPGMTVTVPLYREPEYVLLVSCVPLLLLNIIALCTFAVDHGAYSDRLSIIVTILLALFAFMPTFRSEIPVSAITCLDAAIFCSVLVLLLIIVDSIVYTFVEPEFFFIIPIFAAAIIAGMTLYIVAQYIIYGRKKKHYIALPDYTKRDSSNVDTTGFKAPEDSKLVGIQLPIPNHMG